MPIITALQTAIAAALLSSVLLVLVFALLYRQYRERHMLFWTCSWLCLSLRLGSDFLRQAGGAGELAGHLSQGSALLAGIFLLLGTAEFIGTKVSRVWLAIALASLGWDVLVHLSAQPVTWACLPIFTFYGAMTIWTGWLLLQASRKGAWAQQVTGWLLVLWGMHKLDYPLRWSYPDFAPFAFLLGAFFALAVALGMLLTYFHKVRQLLHRGQDLLQSVLDHTDNAVMALDAEFRVVFVNRRYLELWQLDEGFLGQGPSIGAVIEELCRRGLYPETQVEELVARRMAQLASPLERTSIETPRLDGVVVEGFAARLPGGGVLLTFRDVTAQQRAEGALQRSREHLHALVETVPHGIFECDLQGGVAFANEAYFKMQDQLSPGGRGGSSLFDLIGDEESRDQARQSMDRQLKEGREQGVELLRNRDRNGRTLWRQVDWTVRRSPAGAVNGYIGVVTDVTAQHQAEVQIRAANAQLRQLFHAAPMAIVTLDHAGQILLWNQAAETIFGWDEAAVAGQHFPQFGLPPSEQEPFAILLRRACAGDIVRRDLVGVHRDGRQLDITMVVGPLQGRREPAAEVVLVVDDISERKRVESALRHSEETYRSLVEKTPVAVFVHIDGYLVYLNPAAVGLFGAASAAELEGQAIADYLDAADQPGFTVAVEGAQHDMAQTSRLKLRIRPSSGTVREVEATFLEVEYSGCMARMALCLDVTERNHAERELRSQAEFMQTVLDTIPAPIFYKDAAGRYLGCNHAFAAFLGRGREEIVGRDVYALAPPKLAAIYHEADAKLLRQGGTQVYETEVEAASGERRAILFTKAVFQQKDGTVGGLVGTMLDISERKRVEDELTKSEARFRQLSHEFETIFDGIPDSLTVWSPEMRLVWANRATQEFYRQPASQLDGADCAMLCRRGCGAAGDCEVHRCFATGHGEDLVRTTADGRSWGIKTFPLRDEGGRQVRVIRLASDISERVRLREEAARASHLAALGELAAGVAHEINNPTGLILLDLPIIRDAFRDCLPLLEAHQRSQGEFTLGGLEYSRLRDELPLLLAEVLDGAQRIKQIVEELKDFSRPFDARQFGPVDLGEVVRKAVHLVGNQLKQATDRFELHCDTPLPPCHGNAQRLEQVVINLILNACQALPERNRALQVAVRHQREGGFNIIEVRDEGVGIRPEHLAQVTDPFFTTRRQVGGTGLGLSVSTRIIEEHGGTLHFASSPEGGTVVTVALPVLAREVMHG
ncbi:MAG TPA: hypothetical protein DCF93_05855 [Desulfuromonas sp.]|nr:hypothetical protein [Desulfuromonas sp.]